jgi:hypothetical protein
MPTALAASLILPACTTARATIQRICRVRASQPRLAEERIHSIRAGVRRRSPQASQWQMRKSPRNCRCEALK